MKMIVIYLGLGVILANCANPQKRYDEAWTRANIAGSECVEKYRNGVFKTLMEVHLCDSVILHDELSKVDYPYIDLVELMLARHALIARRVDAGEISKKEAEVMVLEAQAALNSALSQREALRLQRRSAAISAWSAIQSMQPRPPRSIGCTTIGAQTYCN